jgi:hypothetical protein
MEMIISLSHNLIRIIILILPLGLIGGVIGIFLRSKYKNHPKENIIVTGGMALASILLVSLFFLIFM